MDKKQENINEIHAQVTGWTEKWDADGRPEIDPTDPEFVDMINTLMDQDMDTLLVLMGKAAQEAGMNETLNMLNDINDEGMGNG